MTSKRKLEELREQSKEMLQPRYHEYHRNVVMPGFIKITMPAKKTAKTEIRF
jgi:hypothetical protein